MKLLRLTATFGCLDHATLEFGPGLTLIEAPNGGGKSLLTGLITGAIPIKTVLPDGQTGERHIGKGAIRSIVFNDVYGTTPPAYYQQR